MTRRPWTQQRKRSPNADAKPAFERQSAIDWLPAILDGRAASNRHRERPNTSQAARRRILIWPVRWKSYFDDGGGEMTDRIQSSFELWAQNRDSPT